MDDECPDCGRLIGDGDHECAATGGPECAGLVKLQQLILYGPLPLPCPECNGTGEVPGDPPSWENPYGEPPEPCPRGCGVPKGAG